MVKKKKKRDLSPDELVGRNLIAVMDDNDIGVLPLARRAGTSASQMRRIRSGSERRVQLSTLLNVLYALNEMLLERDGLLVDLDDLLHGISIYGVSHGDL